MCAFTDLPILRRANDAPNKGKTRQCVQNAEALKDAVVQVGQGQGQWWSGRGCCKFPSDEGFKQEEILELRQDPRRLCDHRLVT